jgi:hypothetical protein
LAKGRTWFADHAHDLIMFNATLFARAPAWAEFKISKHVFVLLGDLEFLQISV